MESVKDTPKGAPRCCYGRKCTAGTESAGRFGTGADPAMDTTPRPRPDTSVNRGNAGDPRDFIAVNDTDDFSYHPSEHDLTTAFEYVGEAACIIDRAGTQYRLALDTNRHILLGPALGPVSPNGSATHGRMHRRGMPMRTGCGASVPTPQTSCWPASSKPSPWNEERNRPPAHGFSSPTAKANPFRPWQTLTAASPTGK